MTPQQGASGSGGGRANSPQQQQQPPPQLQLTRVLSRDDAYLAGPEFAASALCAAMQLLAAAAAAAEKSPAFPELFQPAADALEALAGVSAAHPVSLASEKRTSVEAKSGMLPCIVAL